MNSSMVVIGLDPQCQDPLGPGKSKEHNSQSVLTQRDGLDASCDKSSGQRRDVRLFVGNNLFVALTDGRWVASVGEIFGGEVGEALVVKFTLYVFQ